MTSTRRALGAAQRQVMQLMTKRNGAWFSGCGWLWGTHSRTNRVCESLRRRGLVERVGETADGYGRFQVTLSPSIDA